MKKHSNYLTRRQQRKRQQKILELAITLLEFIALALGISMAYQSGYFLVIGVGNPAFNLFGLIFPFVAAYAYILWKYGD